MKKIVVAYLYLVLSPTLALNCQCQNASKRNGVQLAIYPLRPGVGDVVCFCCVYKSSESVIHFKRNNETIPCKKRCSREGHILKIKNITREDAGSWTCGNKYGESNVVYIHFDENTPPSSIQPLNNTTTTIFPVTTTSSSSEPDNLWLLWVVLAIVFVLFLAVALISRCWQSKNKSRPYDSLQRQAGRTSRAVRFHAEELLQMSTTDNAADTGNNDDSHSYSSLSSGLSEAAADLPIKSIVRAMVGNPDSFNTEGHTSSPETLSPPGACAVPIQLSIAERNVLNIVSMNIQKVLTATDESSATQTPELPNSKSTVDMEEK